MSKATAKRDAIKAAGGPEYEALLARERAARARFRERHPEAANAARSVNRKKPWRTHIVAKARMRARKRGLEASITVNDLDWPTHCPVLGIELSYPERSGERKTGKTQPNWPSLDRWDNTKGYVPGNVFVVSLRANALKNDATWAELQAVADYARRCPPHLRVVA